jgi:hypothetical protein
MAEATRPLERRQAIVTDASPGIGAEAASRAAVAHDPPGEVPLPRCLAVRPVLGETA